MPESKKLSELIDDFFDIKKQYSFYLENPENVPIYVLVNIRDSFKRTQEQIDQKFEELKCKCEENKSKEYKESLDLFQKLIDNDIKNWKACTVVPLPLKEGLICYHKHTYGSDSEKD